MQDVQCIQLFSFKTAFGGGRSSGFGLSAMEISARNQCFFIQLVYQAEVDAVEKWRSEKLLLLFSKFLGLGVWTLVPAAYIWRFV